jgi:3-methylfumaryl-CoA hydratase
MNSHNLALKQSLQSDAPVIRTEICSVSTVQKVCAMLDLDADDFKLGSPLPRGWQFILMSADTRRSLLRADGFPGLGVPMPDLGLPRLLLGGRTVRYEADVPIGATLTRESSITSITQKLSTTGPMAVVAIEHSLVLAENATTAIVEKQNYLLLPAIKGGVTDGVTVHPSALVGQHIKTTVPDETLLFQYSALGFNSHKIHIDRSHAQNVEGFPDLVVNGGLVTLLLTEFLRNEAGVTPSGLKVKHLAPLYCGRPITMVANQSEGKWHLQGYDHRFTLAVDMEIEPHEL